MKIDKAPVSSITVICNIADYGRTKVRVLLPKEQVRKFIRERYAFWLENDGFSISFKDFLLTEHKDKVQEVQVEDFIEIFL